MRATIPHTIDHADHGTRLRSGYAILLCFVKNNILAFSDSFLWQLLIMNHARHSMPEHRRQANVISKGTGIPQRASCSAGAASCLVAHALVCFQIFQAVHFSYFTNLFIRPSLGHLRQVFGISAQCVMLSSSASQNSNGATQFFSPSGNSFKNGSHYLYSIS